MKTLVARGRIDSDFPEFPAVRPHRAIEIAARARRANRVVRERERFRPDGPRQTVRAEFGVDVEVMAARPECLYAAVLVGSHVTGAMYDMLEIRCAW